MTLDEVIKAYTRMVEETLVIWSLHGPAILTLALEIKRIKERLDDLDPRTAENRRVGPR